jgi:antitoxin HicB
MLSSDGSGAICARVLELPEVQVTADTGDTLATQATDAVLRALMRRMSAQREIPDGAAGPDADHTVSLPLLASVKLTLYREMRAAGVRKAELARRLGCHAPQVDRLLDLTHASRLDQIEAGFRVLGRDLAFTVTAC